ncbi:MAG: cell wall-binding repeat-containing protein, partial [Chloroflexota bacterium]|nr:cell wall-binding repeat-containing protein [Chloroflexota bacterium]
LRRLRPRRIVVVGGPQVVSDTVVAQLATFTTGPVVRIAGADRYATSARISASTFGPGVSAAYIATGLAFPDALAGAAAGASYGAPILLTARGAVPAPIAAELARLKPRRIVVLGGDAVISSGVQAALGRFAPVRRLAGVDRIATSVQVSLDAFGAHEPTTIYIATGGGFPDALTGGPLAGQSPGPLLLAGNTLPTRVTDEIRRLNPSSVIILGGTGVVPDVVVQQIRALFDNSTYSSH